jgi:hypothetical protein
MQGFEHYCVRYWEKLEVIQDFTNQWNHRQWKKLKKELWSIEKLEFLDIEGMKKDVKYDDNAMHLIKLSIKKESDPKIRKKLELILQKMELLNSILFKLRRNIQSQARWVYLNMDTIWTDRDKIGSLLRLIRAEANILFSNNLKGESEKELLRNINYQITPLKGRIKRRVVEEAAHIRPILDQVSFSGFTWMVKGGYSGPGPNNFSKNNVWLDSNGELHLRVAQLNGKWTCAEVYLNRPLGFGTYIFEIKKQKLLDKNITLGLFTYEDDNNEIDIEFGRWGRNNNKNVQYVVQPVKKFVLGKSIQRYKAESERFVISFNWREDKVEFNSSFAQPSWTYKGKNIPSSRRKEKVHINLWIYGGKGPEKEEEVVIRKFIFRP